MEEVSIVVRWAHLLLGITWIGVLYYFNFVQGGFFNTAEQQVLKKTSSGLTPCTLRWFRWSTTLIFGFAIYLLWKVDGLFNHYILVTAMMVLFMFLNVRLIIWPAQQIALGFKQGDRMLAAERAILASRTNALFYLPMAYCMIASMNKGYLPEHMLSGSNASGLDFNLSIALFAIVALELNVIFGKRSIKTSMRTVVQTSMALTGVLFVSLVYL
ncbi:MAG: antitermination protein NusG [Arenicella sp.]